MISKVIITGVKYDLTDDTKKYVEKKIGALDRFLPRHARKTTKADIKIKQIDKSGGNKYEVEVILSVPDKKLTAKDSTLNVLAAVDIVEEKLAVQLRKYKQTHLPHVGGSRKLLAKFKRSFQREK